jgi:protein-S-isoprenylcysteine O-methyltransferase Ste14
MPPPLSPSWKKHAAVKVETGMSEIQTKSLVARLKALRGTKVYDLLAAAPLIIWYGICLTVRLPHLARQVMTTDWVTADVTTISSLTSMFASLIFITTLIVLLALRHTPRARIPGLAPRIAAVAGTYLSVGIVLLPPAELSARVHLTATILILAGTVFALYSALKLGRSLSMLPEARRLVTSGPYALVRHPLYLGEAIAIAGLTLQFMSPWTLIVFGLQCACQIARMSSEERILTSVFPEYRNYMAHTARLLPHIY